MGGLAALAGSAALAGLAWLWRPVASDWMPIYPLPCSIPALLLGWLLPALVGLVGLVARSTIRRDRRVNGSGSWLTLPGRVVID